MYAGRKLWLVGGGQAGADGFRAYNDKARVAEVWDNACVKTWSSERLEATGCRFKGKAESLSVCFRPICTRLVLCKSMHRQPYNMTTNTFIAQKRKNSEHI